MSLESNKLLQALDDLTQDCTCGVCSQLCDKPVVLSACFHCICAKHFAQLTNCPTCKIPLAGCTTYTDPGLEATITSTRALNAMFEPFRNNTPSQPNADASKKRGNKENVKEKENINTYTSKLRKVNKSDHLDSSITSTGSSKIKANEKRNKKGETALHVACCAGKVNLAIDLLKDGANSNTKDNAGWTPLHEVVQRGRLDLVKLLLQYNTLINVPGPGNETPLHEAVRYNHKEIAQELVKNGADITAINCKGETPMQLASKEMKKVLEEAADDIIQTQGVNVTFMSEQYAQFDLEDMRVHCVSQFRTAQGKLKVLAKHHTNIHVEPKFTKNVNILIVDSENDFICTSSLDVLQAIVNGIWIISVLWISQSSNDKLELLKDYEIKGVGNKTYNGPYNSRFNKYKQLPGIFNGCHFYLHNFNQKYEISKSIVLNKAILTKLITDAGGIVLRRVPNPESIPENERLVPYHAKKDGKLVNCSHYIIFKDNYEPMYNMSHFKALPIGWLIECIEKYELCEPW